MTQDFPKLKFQLADARDFRVDTPFDAVFSIADKDLKDCNK